MLPDLKFFCLPYNGDNDFTLEYCSEHRSKIYEVYGADGEFYTGRYTNCVEHSKLLQLIDGLSSIGIGFNYILNSIYVEDYIRNEEKLVSFLAQLRESGVVHVTVAHPFMVEIVSNLGFKAVTSLVQNIRTIEEVRWAKHFGYSRIICSDDLNRRFGEMKSLVKMSSVPVEVVVNNMCLPSCPLRLSHYGIEAYMNQNGRCENIRIIKKRIAQCRSMWADNPALFLKSSWLRPDDLERMVNIGIKHFKIAGRDRSSLSLRQTFDAYLSGTYQGGIFDYLLPGCSPVSKYGINNFDNRSLDTYFDYILSEDGCKGDCGSCDFCSHYFEML